MVDRKVDPWTNLILLPLDVLLSDLSYREEEGAGGEISTIHSSTF